MAMTGDPAANRRAKIIVNPIACVAHGVCADLFPERISLDEWGYPIIDPRPIPDHLLGHARRAVAGCPTLALLILDARRP
jgi:ferredoxin